MNQTAVASRSAVDGRRCHPYLRGTRSILSGLLIALALPAACFGVTVTNRMLTKAVDTSGGCPVPTPATSFLTTDQKVWIWFNVTGANAGDLPSATWYSPGGAAYLSGNWNPVASAGTWCFWWSIDVAGSAAASSPGNWSIGISWNGSSLFTVNFTILAPGPSISISPGGILNAASYLAGASLAPGSIVAVFGSFPVSSPSMTPGAPWPTSLAGLSLQFNSGIKAPQYYVSSTQANLLVPWEVANQSQTTLTAVFSGQSSSPQTVNLATYSPGIFSMNGQGTGQGAVVDALSGVLVDLSHPAIAGGTYISIYGTGLGPVTNQPASGAASPSNPLAMTIATPTVSIGGAPAQVIFSGLAPGFVGEYQVNALVPRNVAPGSAVPVVLSIGGKISNTVTIAIQAPTGGPAPTLTSVNPAAGAAGQVITVALTASNTGFLQGQTTASFGPGISVGGAPEGQVGPLRVVSPTAATATITIDPAASPGIRTITVNTGGQTASLNNAFTVTPTPQAIPPLAVTSTSPGNRATGVSLTPTVQVIFNDPLDPGTIGPSTFSLSNGTATLPVTLLYDSAKYIVSVTPNFTLNPGTTYTLTVGAGLKNAAENQLGTAYGFSFTTTSPISVTGTITPAPGLDPRTLTVISYGGKTSTPDASGTFAASVNPSGNTLVAAVSPGKTSALLAMLTNGSPPLQPAGIVGTFQPVPALAPALGQPQVYRNQWQTTASTAAATSANPVIDYQTTAETLVFISPYVYTGDPAKSTFTMAAIAKNQSTKQFAATLQTQMTGTNAPAHPMTVPAVQSAGQTAVQEAVNTLLPQFTNLTNADSTPPTILDVGCSPSKASSTFPATVKVTPYCKPNSSPQSGELPCLDLDYISFCGAVTTDQNSQNYTFKPLNCTNRTWGCAVGWLARVAPISDGADPATITSGGANPSEPESPDGHTSACTPGNCRGAWIEGNSAFANADIFGVFSDWVVGLISKDSTGNFVLPSTTGTYIARFYSGGVADSQENASVVAGAYTDGTSLSALAAGVNMAETALNLADMAFSLADAVAPGAGSARQALAKCAVVNVTQAAITAAAGQASGTVSGGVKAIGSLGAAMLTNAASCPVSLAAQSALKMAAEWLTASTGVGAAVDAAVNVAAAAGNAAEALQRSYELANTASALETAVIQILPGSGTPLNPVPKISSLSPASAPVGSSSLTVSIKGSAFLQNCTVLANNVKRSYSYVNSGTLTITLNSSDLAQAGSFSVEVRNPAPGGGTSSSSFVVTSGATSNPQPQITSISPAAVAVGANPPVMTILGKNFLSNSIVTLGGSPHPITTPFDAAQLTIALATPDLAKTGTVPVVVTNPGPGGGSSTFSFTVVDVKSAQPYVTSISTPQREYIAGDQFELDYAVLANPSSSTRYDLMITVMSQTSGNTYYYYDDSSDTSRWLHSSARAAKSNYVPQSGGFIIPSDPTAFQITSDVPTGDYHVKAYFSAVGANQPVGSIAQTDFSVATDTAAGGCFIATAAFGSSMTNEVRSLRIFRDRILLSASAGRSFVNWYYSWSPRGARWLRAHPTARKLARAALWIPVAFAGTSVRTGVGFATLAFLALFLAMGWTLRRGPLWWRVLWLLIVVIAIASAEVPRSLVFPVKSEISLKEKNNAASSLDSRRLPFSSGGHQQLRPTPGP